jgi:hypothetical protein
MDDKNWMVFAAGTVIGIFAGIGIAGLALIFFS